MYVCMYVCMYDIYLATAVCISFYNHNVTTKCYYNMFIT